MKSLRCIVGLHDWETKQVGVETTSFKTESFVLAWKQCRCCARSKLIHVLM